MALLAGKCKAEIVLVRTILGDRMENEALDCEAAIDPAEHKQLPLLLRRAWYGLNQAVRRQICHAGATPNQLTALRSLSEAGKGGLTQSELTRSMSSDPNTVASLLERMEKNGWLERRPHETDRRAKRILLLPAGGKKYAELCECAVDLQGEILATLPESRRDVFLEELSKVADACHGVAQKAGRKTNKGI
tara:strand:- start:621 stop:1193 length:573 start_codon:yes stop_codon:yes gene_type:complete